MNITDEIVYVGVNDRDIDLFEGQYHVPNGMAYNSYVILSEKIAVIDTVDRRFTEEWLENVKKVLNGRTPDYLIIQHMEPDHSSGITLFMETFKDAQIVASAKAFTMMKNFFGDDFAERKIEVTEGSTLEVGSHILSFVAAPMVHWPEVMLTYDSKDKIVFSADAFGKFGALDADEECLCEARRYYIGIVGKYGVQVQNLLKKLAKLEVSQICPLHGPVLNENLEYYLSLYNTWSLYDVETDGVLIAYTSV
jgi:flavorubredoxin